jgi:hypothetical protein
MNDFSPAGFGSEAGDQTFAWVSSAPIEAIDELMS